MDITALIAYDRKKAARMLFQLPRESRVYRKIQPATEWGYGEIFMNKMVYLLETLVWQNSTPSKKGDQAKHKAQKPVQFIPDFMKKTVNAKEGIAKDTVAAPVDEIKAILARPRK